MRSRWFLVLGSLVVASAVHAQDKPRVEQVPIPRISPIEGKEMFDAYCTPCHGKTGRGDGPAGAALKRAPADLTTLASRNGGQFPETRVRRYIEGLDEVAAHGTRDMPIWGPLFRRLSPDTAALRVQSLASHLKSMQR